MCECLSLGVCLFVFFLMCVYVCVCVFIMCVFVFVCVFTNIKLNMHFLFSLKASVFGIYASKKSESFSQTSRKLQL